MSRLRGAGDGFVSFRPGHTGFHPLREVSDLAGGELLVLGRHLEIRVGVADSFDEETFPGVAGNDGRAGVAALEQTFERIEVKPALELLGLRAVAGVAVLGEQRTDFGFEEGEVGGW